MIRLKDLFEATQLTVDNKVVAVRSFAGKDRGTIVTMQIPQSEWKYFKNKQADTDDASYDLATAERIIRDWEEKGAKVVWKTPADWNRAAKELEGHRFKDEIPGMADTAAEYRQTAKDELKTILKRS